MDTESLIDIGKDKDAGEIEFPSFVRKYMNQRVAIESFEVHKGKVFEGRQSYYLKLSTKVLGKESFLDKLTGEKRIIEVRATRIFSLAESEGKIGWGSKGELAKYLKKHSVTHYKALVGKSVTTTLTERNEQEYLTFV